MADHDRVEVTTRAELRAWLEVNHTQSEPIWLVTYKKAAGPDLHLPWGDVVKEALCFGWIDSQAKTVDEQRHMVRLSPRRRGSPWSAINKAHVEELAADGLMTEAGWARIEEAKADGSWEFYDDVEAGIIPGDLAEAFAMHPGSSETFDGFPASVRKGALGWIKSAKRAETRANRIAQVVDRAADGLRPSV